MELGKIPPHDIEAEQAILGSMLTDKDAVILAIEVLKPEDFYREDNKIYKPYEETGIKQGDSIIEVNGKKVKTTDELILCVSESKGEKIDIKYDVNPN
mgnify:CR=1 FL=1